MIVAVGMAVGMVESSKNGVIMEFDWSYIMCIVKLVHKLRVCVVIAQRAIAIASLILTAIGMPSVGM